MWLCFLYLFFGENMTKNKIKDAMSKIYEIDIPKYQPNMMIVIKDGVPVFWSPIMDDVSFFLEQEKKIVIKWLRKNDI
jgi:hypothetical protein